MIDFELTELDQEILAEVRRQALICRKYARHLDENEAEFVPKELPEAKDFKNPFSLMAKHTEKDTPLSVIAMLVAAGAAWGDYSVRMREDSGGLGNAALRASGTPEQIERWKD